MTLRELQTMDVDPCDVPMNPTTPPLEFVVEDTDHDVKSDTQTTDDTSTVTLATDPLCAECADRVSVLHRPLVSPLEHLLSETKRHLPTPAEEVQIRQVIEDATTRIAEIDSTAAQIKLILNELAKERVKVQEFANKHWVMVAPVWELPPEILSYIFVLCLPHRPAQEIKRNTLRRSLTMSRVNRHWRYVALSTPQLWTTIYIDPKSLSPEEELEDPICMPRILLKRSGACPLTLCISAGTYCQEILDFIIPLSERWHHIILDANLSMLEALESIRGRLPLLRTLEIKSCIRGADEPEKNHLAFFTDAPLLRHVTLSSHFTSSFRVLPWCQLASFDGPVALPDMPQIFELGPNLEECFIQPTRQPLGHPVPEPIQNASHNNLTSLHLSTGLFFSLNLQLQHLPQFPALRHLFMYYDKRVMLNNADVTLIPFFAKSGAHLEHLTFGVSAGAPTIRRCLELTPSVTSLQIHRVANDLLLEYLALPPDDETILLPRLEVLRLSGKIYYKAQSVTNIIRARWRAPPPESSSSISGHVSKPPHMCLKAIHILPPRHEKFDVDAKKEMLSFNEQGFAVHIRQLDRTAFLSHTPYNTLC